MLTNLLFIFLSIALIVILILLVFTVRAQKNNLFLALHMFCLCYSVVALWLMGSGRLSQVPYLARVGNIFGYLVYPMLYLFVRNTFYPGRLWGRRDFLLLLPVAIYIIDMLPFFLSSSNYKVTTVQQNLQNGREVFTQPEGWLLPTGFHAIFRVIWCAFLYVLVCIVLFRNWKYEQKNPNPVNNKPVFRFIAFFPVMYAPLTTIMLWGSITKALWWDTWLFAVVLAIPLFSVALFMLFSPGALYGFRPLNFQPVGSKPESEVQNLIPAEEITPGDNTLSSIEEEKKAPVENDQEITDDTTQSKKYARLLNDFMESNQPFREPGLTIHRLAELSGIPVYIISYVVNRNEQTNYSSWVNQYRINYFVQIARNQNFRQYTLEALANEVGFSSRVTLSKVFKSQYGVSPGKYLRSVSAVGVEDSM